MIRIVGALLLLLVGGCAPLTLQGKEESRYLIYFNEFSAYLSADAHRVIETAAQRAHEIGATGVVIEGRASATGSPAANQYLTETRTQVVYDELQKDGISPAIMQQRPFGQTTTTDTSVMDRRVDIVLLK